MRKSSEKDLAGKHAALAEEVEAMFASQKALIDQNESLQVQLKEMTGEVDAMRSRLAEIQSLAGSNAAEATEPAPAEQPAR